MIANAREHESTSSTIPTTAAAARLLAVVFASLVLHARASAQGVTVVASPQSVQAAVNAAADGDILLLQSATGFLDAFTISGKSLTIVALVRVSLGGGCSITNLPAGKTVTLRNLEMSDSLGPGLTIANCAGAVHIEGCRLFGSSYIPGAAALEVHNSAAVSVVQSSLQGADGFSTGPNGGPALLAIDSSLRVYNATLQAGSSVFNTGAPALTFSATQPGLHCEVLRSLLRVSNGCPSGAAVIANGPANTEVVLTDTSIIPGTPTAGCTAGPLMQGNITPIVRSVGQCSFSPPLRATWGGTWSSAVVGGPNQLAYVAIDTQPRGFLYRVCDSYAQVDPFNAAVLFVGVTNSLGVLGWTQPIPPLSIAGVQVQTQCGTFDAVSCRLSEPHSSLILGPQF